MRDYGLTIDPPAGSIPAGSAILPTTAPDTSSASMTTGVAGVASHAIHSPWPTFAASVPPSPKTRRTLAVPAGARPMSTTGDPSFNSMSVA
jgi:hypothetical protein